MSKILILKEHWLDLILSGEKSMEIRGAPLKAGTYYLGCKKNIYAVAAMGPPIAIATVDHWDSLRPQHRVQSAELPYAKTFGMPILEVRRVNRMPFAHPRGAIGIVRYRAP